MSGTKKPIHAINSGAMRTRCGLWFADLRELDEETRPSDNRDHDAHPEVTCERCLNPVERLDTNSFGPEAAKVYEKTRELVAKRLKERADAAEEA